MPTYERLDYGSAHVDGSQWGASTDLIAFYGAIPVAQSTLPTVGAASTYVVHAASSDATPMWGFETQAAMSSMIRQVSTLTVALQRLGLFA